MTPIDIFTALFIAFLVVCILWLVLGTLFLAALLLLPWSCLKYRPQISGDEEWARTTSGARRLQPHEVVSQGDFHRGSMGQKSLASGYELGQQAGAEKGWYRPLEAHR